MDATAVGWGLMSLKPTPLRKNQRCQYIPQRRLERNMIYSFKPKPVLMQILVCAVFSEKDKGCLCSESGCSDILILFCSRVSAIQMGLGTEWCLVGHWETRLALQPLGWWYLLEDRFRLLFSPLQRL